MATLLKPEPSDRVALKIWDSLTVAKLHLDMVRRSGAVADQTVRFDAIGRELEALAFHVRQILATSSPIEVVLPGDLSLQADMLV